jgi:hypothetical protein
MKNQGLAVQGAATMPGLKGKRREKLIGRGDITHYSCH